MQIRDYQLEGAEKIKNLVNQEKIALVVWEVRTGKTLTSLFAASLLAVTQVLFVTKKKAISSIEKDYQLLSPTYKIDIINYEQLHNYFGSPDLVIIDESHCLSQFPTPARRTIELRKICTGLPIIFLSGTVTPESFSQFFHQFFVSSFGPWEGINFYAWFKIYGIPKVKYIYNRQISDYSCVRLDEIKKITDKYMITYTQVEAGFEMPVEEEVLKVPMSEHIKWAVGKLRKDKLFRTQAGDVILADTAVKEMQKVHQCCSGTVKTEDGNAIVFDWTKANYVKETFRGQKIAIFYKYVAEEMQLRAMFNPKVTTDPVEFNASQDMVFISQVQSGREGINLSTADCLVMYNIDFSALSYWQARARLQTRDRAKPAKVYWIFTEGGIEEKIYAVVQGKKDFTLSHYRRLK